MVGPRAIALAPTVTLIVLNVTYVYKILKKYDDWSVKRDLPINNNVVCTLKI